MLLAAAINWNDKNGQRMTTNSITFILICVCTPPIGICRHTKQMFPMKFTFRLVSVFEIGWYAFENNFPISPKLRLQVDSFRLFVSCHYFLRYALINDAHPTNRAKNNNFY